MPSIRHHPDYDDMVAEQQAVRRQINTLKRRAGLHPMDPDALDEDEQERLEELENWEP